ncbi:MAG: 4'-phosphopantetheinyl transferase family protein [Myxococcota bacterium]
MKTDIWRPHHTTRTASFTRWVEPAGPVSLEAGLVDVWRLELDQPSDVVSHFEQILSDDEFERAERFRVRSDRRAYVMTRAVLRTLLARYLDHPRVKPENVPIATGAWGKPMLGFSRMSDHARIEFNVSHSGGLALLAFARDVRVGADVERVRVDYEAHSRARRFFTELEIEAMESIPEDQRVHAFFRCWTRKEAFMKATGQGFHLGMDSFSVSVGDDQPRVLEYREGSPADWQVYSMEVGEDHAASVVVNSPSPLQLRTMSATVSNSSSVQLDL